MRLPDLDHKGDGVTCRVLESEPSTPRRQLRDGAASRLAYFCLTVLELHGGRSGAAARFGISSRLLDTLGRLATETGDESTARKALADLRLPTPAETQWLEAAVQTLIRRVGEVAASPNASATQITLADLPQL